LVVWERASGLTPADLAAVTAAVSRLSAVEGVSGDAVGPIPSDDGKAVQVVVPLPADNSAFEELPGVVENLTEAAQVQGLPSYVTGPAGSSPTSPPPSRASTGGCCSPPSASCW
jgi:RND superfamily putative drug exporter